MTRVLFGRTLLGVLLGLTPVIAAPLPADGAQAAGTCIAIGLPAVQGVEGSAVDVGNALRELFSGFLSGPSINVVTLDARLASQAAAEARQKECGHVLTATLTRKRSGGGSRLGRVLGQAGSTAAWTLPGGGAGTAAARIGAAAGAAAVSEVAYTTKSKDEMRLEYQVASSDGRVVLKPTEEKLKASVDGEDLLTPLVRKASESIVAALPPSR